MRASGSHSVTFAGVELPGAAIRGGFVAGDAEAYMDRNLVAGLFHASASLGIAEAAVESATRALAKRRPGRAHADPGRRERDRARCGTRHAVARGGARGRTATIDLVTLFAQTQAAKAFVNEASARIVDRALAASGGAGYLNGHPLARAYRDVRAGSFMHPLGANRAYDFLGDVALGREVVLH